MCADWPNITGVCVVFQGAWAFTRVRHIVGSNRVIVLTKIY